MVTYWTLFQKRSIQAESHDVPFQVLFVATGLALLLFHLYPISLVTPLSRAAQLNLTGWGLRALILQPACFKLSLVASEVVSELRIITTSLHPFESISLVDVLRRLITI